MSLVLAHGDHEQVNALFSAMPIIAGLIAGVAHVLTGPDHMAAVAPLAVEQHRRTWIAGCLWGIGHSGSVFLLASLALIFREALPIDTISSWAEFLVGFVLIAVGVWGVHRVIRLHVHTHTHMHTHTHESADGHAHEHAHTHVHATAPGKDHAHRGKTHSHSHSLLGIGALHGMAGTSHLLGVIPALGMPTRAGAVGYTIAFGLGSIIGMGVFAGAIGMLIRAASSSGRNITKGLLSLSSIASIGVGVWWLSVA